MPRARTKSGREADATRPVRTVFLRRGASTRLHRHGEPSAWTQVIAGRMVDERWYRDDDGRLHHERRVLRADQTLCAPTGAMHRVRALEDVAFVTTCADDCGCADAADPSEARAVRAAHAESDLAAVTTAVGVAAPAVRRRRR